MPHLMPHVTLLDASRTFIDAVISRNNFERGGGRQRKRSELLSERIESFVSQIESDTGYEWRSTCNESDEQKALRQLSPKAAQMADELKDVVLNPWKLDTKDQAR